MSTEWKKRDEFPKPDFVWKKLLSKMQEGLNLTSEEEQSLELRRITLSLMDAIDTMMHDETLNEDVLKQAEAIARFWDARKRLLGMGISRDVDFERTPDTFSDPLKVAILSAQTFVFFDENRIKSGKFFKHQVSEFALETIKTDGMIISIMNPSDISQPIMDMMVMEELLGIGRSLLSPEVVFPTEILPET